MRRGAIYARYSTDLQNERSVEDQIALCRAYAERERIQIVETFHDRARSGGSMFERDGLLRMLAAVQGEKPPFEVIVVEALDRLSRDMEDLAGIHKRLSFAGVELAAVHDGVANTVLIGLRGLVGQLFREDGAKKIRRGLAGVVRQGRVAGGLCYGYRMLAGRPGEREIDDEQATVVRRIFTEYLAGRSARQIATALNKEGIPAPTGSVWNASTINGQARRGIGILNNELYAGRIVWNRTRKVRNPYTGRRINRVNEADAREVSEAPHLRILDEGVFESVRDEKAKGSGKRPEQHRRAVYLLSGLIKCGRCGGGVTVHGRDRHGVMRIKCSAIRESGTCTATKKYALPMVERLVVDGMKDQLRDPAAIEEYLHAYNDERRRLAMTAKRNTSQIETKLKAAEREFTRVFEGWKKGLISEEEAETELPAARKARDRLREEYAAATEEAPSIALHPGRIAEYLRQVEDLGAELAGFAKASDQASADLVTKFRAMVESVTILSTEPGQPLEIEVKGRLANIVGPEAFPAGTYREGVSVVRKRDSNQSAIALK